jgi:hypothetical protein
MPGGEPLSETSLEAHCAFEQKLAPSVLGEGPRLAVARNPSQFGLGPQGDATVPKHSDVILASVLDTSVELVNESRSRLSTRNRHF